MLPLPDALFLAAIGLLVGLLGAIGGSGGVLAVPSMMLAGLSPVAAIGTNKVVSMLHGTATAVHFWRQKLVALRQSWPGMATAFLFGGCGAMLVAHLDAALLKTIIPYVLIALGFYFMLSGAISDAARKAHLSRKNINILCVPPIAFYDGFFGPAANSFIFLVFSGLLGLEAKRASAEAKYCDLSSSASALLVFLGTGHIDWAVVALMAGGSLLGGWLGARLVVLKGAKLVKPVTVLTCFFGGLRLLWG